MKNKIYKMLINHYEFYDFDIEETESNFCSTYFIKNNYDGKKYILRKRKYENSPEMLKIINSKIFLKNILDEKILNIENYIYYLYESKNDSIEYIDLDDVSEYIRLQKNNCSCMFNINEVIRKWESKVDYIEEILKSEIEIDENILTLFNYFIGLTEVAINYLKQNLKVELKQFIMPCNIFHKRIYKSMRKYELYDPYNYIIDNKIRDISEYIKSQVIEKDIKKIEQEISKIDNMKLSLFEKQYLISRIVFPTFFYDKVDEYLLNNKNKTILIETLNYLDKYETALNCIINQKKEIYL